MKALLVITVFAIGDVRSIHRVIVDSLETCVAIREILAAPTIRDAFQTGDLKRVDCVSWSAPLPEQRPLR